MSEYLEIATATQGDPDTNRRALRIFHIYRMIVAALLLILYLADFGTNVLETAGDSQWFLILVQSYAAIVLITYGVSYLPRAPLCAQVHLALLVDVVVLVLVSQAAGGTESGLSVLLVPSIAAGGLLLPGRSALAYGALAFLTLAGVSLYSSEIGYTDLARIGVLGSIFLITAIVSSVLAEKAQRSDTLARERALALEEMARLNETIVQRMQTGLVAVDPDQNVRLMNQAARQALSCQRDPTGQPLTMVAPALATHLEKWQASPNRPGGPAEEPDELPGLLVAYMQVGNNGDSDTIAFLERRRDAEARLQQVKLAAVGRLTAGIAHEIRNPLAAVSNAAQLLEESDSLQPGEQRIAEIIRNNARRMNRIVENILQVSRRDQARPRLLLVKPFLENFRDEFLSTRPLPFKSLDIAVNPEDAQILFDPGHLHQVIWNLCQNACRHGACEGEEARIVVQASRQTGQSAIVLEVIDSGPGVMPEQEQNLFEPFFTTSTKGTGLGLYLSKELCQFNKAELSYQPGPGGGSCFRITFSAKENPEESWPIELH